MVPVLYTSLEHHAGNTLWENVDHKALVKIVLHSPFPHHCNWNCVLSLHQTSRNIPAAILFQKPRGVCASANPKAWLGYIGHKLFSNAAR